MSKFIISVQTEDATSSVKFDNYKEDNYQNVVFFEDNTVGYFNSTEPADLEFFEYAEDTRVELTTSEKNDILDLIFEALKNKRKIKFLFAEV